MPTLTINNFQGRLTRYNNGDINSGYAKYSTTFGNDPFSNPGNLTWFEQPIAFGNAISDLVMAAKPCLESGITYIYAIGDTGRLYKIQVNNPVTFNPNYDNDVLITTLTASSPTFKYGSSIQFYGATEKLFIGHDLGVTKIAFDGTGEALVGVLGSYTANVPRPSAQFLGKLYFGNGNNILEIDSTENVTSYAKLSPGFPSGTYVRDMDVSPDGNYLQIIVSRINSPDLTSTVQDTTSFSSTDSYKFLWNGMDAGYTSHESFNGYSITSNITFGPYSYTMGYDLGGAAIYSGGQKLVSLPTSISPNFGAMFSTGNLVGFGSPDFDSTVRQLAASVMVYGQYDEEIPKGLFRFFRYNAAGEGSLEPIQIPVCLIVSNLLYGSSLSGYTENQAGAAKLYFSALGANGTSAFFKFTTVPTGLGTPIQGIYETQNQLFSKRVQIKKVRIYTNTFNNNGDEFKIELIGPDGNTIADEIFGEAIEDFWWWTPQKMAPVYSVGVRITNTGIRNFVINKIEIDYSEGGK